MGMGRHARVLGKQGCTYLYARFEDRGSEPRSQERSMYQLPK